jgi:hypothetical protein
MNRNRSLRRLTRNALVALPFAFALVAIPAKGGQPCCGETVVSAAVIHDIHDQAVIHDHANVHQHAIVHEHQPIRPATFSQPSGVWRGYWHSDPTGHRGPINAKIRQVSPDRYEALFYGRFFVVIPFAYRATLTRVPGTADLFQSSKQMPIVGNYQTTARIRDGHFDANFSSGKDTGVFRMTRRR